MRLADRLMRPEGQERAARPLRMLLIRAASTRSLLSRELR